MTAASHAFDSGSIAANLAREIDLAESDLFEFGGLHCDGVVVGVLAKLAR